MIGDPKNTAELHQDTPHMRDSERRQLVAQVEALTRELDVKTAELVRLERRNRELENRIQKAREIFG